MNVTREFDEKINPDDDENGRLLERVERAKQIVLDVNHSANVHQDDDGGAEM